MVTPEQAKNLADLLESFTDGQTVDQCVFALRDLAAQVEALQADAARYKKLRNVVYGNNGTLYIDLQNISVDASIEYALDESVDAMP